MMIGRAADGFVTQPNVTLIPNFIGLKALNKQKMT